MKHTINPVKFLEVIRRTNGEKVIAIYDRNRLGNWRMWVDGRFYTDKEFSRHFTQLNNNDEKS